MIERIIIVIIIRKIFVLLDAELLETWIIDSLTKGFMGMIQIRKGIIVRIIIII